MLCSRIYTFPLEECVAVINLWDATHFDVNIATGCLRAGSELLKQV